MTSALNLSYVLLVLSSMKAVTSFPTNGGPGGPGLSSSIMGTQQFDRSVEPQSCIGTIKMITQENVMHSVSSSEGDVNQKNYGVVESITVEGTCCWRVARRKNYLGTTTDFTGAVTERIHRAKVKSVKRIECENGGS